VKVKELIKILEKDGWEQAIVSTGILTKKERPL